MTDEKPTPDYLRAHRWAEAHPNSDYGAVRAAFIAGAISERRQAGLEVGAGVPKEAKHDGE